MTTDSLKLLGHRFTNNVRDLHEEEIQRRADQIAEYLADPSHIGSFGMVADFYRDGFVREMGYQYMAETPIRILVNNGWDKTWILRYVTSRDPEIIDQFIEEYDGGSDGSTRWAFYPEDIHEVYVSD